MQSNHLGLRIIVYTRFDSNVVNTLELAHDFGRTLESEKPMPLVLELFNNSGDRLLGTDFEHGIGVVGLALAVVPPPNAPWLARI